MQQTAGAAAYVIDVNTENFQRDVVDRSRQQPVVVDLWAPWCQPCRTLGPTLEKLAAEAQGAWLLAKVNVDENPQISQMFGVQGIPAVKAVWQERLVDEFTGALPESQVRAWLKRFLPAAAAPAAPAEDLAALEASDPREAAARYRVLLAEQPTDELRLALGRLLLLQGSEEALALLGEIAPGSPAHSRAQGMLSYPEFFLSAADAAAEGPSGAAYAQAAADARAGRHAEAAQALLGIVARDRGFRADAGRKALLALLATLGDENPLASEYRRKLSALLF